MNLTSVYDHMPVFVQNRIVAHYGRRLHRMRFGGIHTDHYREILRCEEMTDAEMRAHQAQRLRRILNEAAEYVPYYRPRAEELRRLAHGLDDPAGIASLPIIEKSEVNANPALFHTTRPLRRRIYGNTSGTTGRPIRTLKEPDSYQRNWAYLVRCKETHGVRLGARRASFGTRMVVPVRQERPPFWRREPAENNVYFSLFHMSEENIPWYIDELMRWDPEEIVGYPSGLAVLAESMLTRGEALPGRRTAFMQAETLFGWQRERIATAFSARVVNIYGLAENVAWIYECPQGRLHIRPDYGYTELIPVNGAVGGLGVFEIVSTGLINLAMPLIRYRTGDQVLVTEADHVPCTCGLRFPTVTEVIGRADDNLITRDGRVQTRLDGIFKAIPHVRESQIEQIGIDRFRIRVVPQRSGSQPGIGEVTRRVRKIFGTTADCEIVYVDRLPRTPAGKIRYQINSMPKEELAQLRCSVEAGLFRIGEPSPSEMGYASNRPGAFGTNDAHPLPSSVLQDP